MNQNNSFEKSNALKGKPINQASYTQNLETRIKWKVYPLDWTEDRASGIEVCRIGLR